MHLTGLTLQLMVTWELSVIYQPEPEPRALIIMVLVLIFPMVQERQA